MFILFGHTVSHDLKALPDAYQGKLVKPLLTPSFGRNDALRIYSSVAINLMEAGTSRSARAMA
jgi:hypothetical protein